MAYYSTVPLVLTRADCHQTLSYPHQPTQCKVSQYYGGLGLSHHANLLLYLVLLRIFLSQLFLAGLALGAPAEPNPTELSTFTDVLKQGYNDVQPSDVISRMEQDLGELNWVPSPRGGRLLTLPREQWYKYVAIVKEDKAIKRNQERQAIPGFVRLPSGICRWEMG